MFGFSPFADGPFAALPLAALPSTTLAPALFVNTNTFYSPALVYRQDVYPNTFVNTNTFYSPTVSAAYALAPALFVNTNTFYSPALVYRQDVYPNTFVNTNTFYGAFAYLYPFHPNDLRPGGGSLVPGLRGPMPAAPNAGRANMPLSASTRRPMPYE